MLEIDCVLAEGKRSKPTQEAKDFKVLVMLFIQKNTIQASTATGKKKYNTKDPVEKDLNRISKNQDH